MEPLIGEITSIDRRTCTRVVPMRVICAGLPRTGTTSLRAALKRLGFDDTYHMVSAAFENVKDCEMWADALRAKYDGVGEFTKENWDQLLGHCQAVTDYPSATFIPELVATYPDAKVILNTRDVNAWFKSVSDTVYLMVYSAKVKNASEGELQSPNMIRDQMIDRLWQVNFSDDFKSRGKEVFLGHYDMVRRLVPKDNLLEYSVKDGWEPLCKFLGVPVPDVRFPHLNDTAAFLELAKLVRYGSKD